MSEPIDVLDMALAAEHAAIYGYGIAGAYLDAATRNIAHEAEGAHRNRRDALLLRIAGASASPPAAGAAYNLPFPVTDRDGALKLAVALEEGTARAWRQAIPSTSGDERKMALEALSDCAVRATHWRVTAGINPATVAFPGAVTK